MDISGVMAGITGKPCALERGNERKYMTHRYIGTKEVTAWAAQKDGKDGYGVKYADGYTSWSPKDAFEEAYRTSEPGMDQALNYGDALHYLKLGKKVARTGWNGKGMFVFLVQGSVFKVSRAPLLGIYPEGTTIDYRAHTDIRNADGTIATWVPSQGDHLANDWMVLPD